MFQWKKSAALILVLATALAGSAAAAGNKIISPSPAAAQKTAEFSLQTGAKENSSRSVEGSKVEVEVTRYTLNPYHISFAMDSDFKPAVDAKRQTVAFIRSVTAKQKINVTLQMFKGKKLTEAGSALQKEYVRMGYKRVKKAEIREKGHLQGTVIIYSGKSQYAGYTLYPLKNGVLAVKHTYPLDAGDGMEPLLAQLRASIAVK